MVLSSQNFLPQHYHICIDVKKTPTDGVPPIDPGPTSEQLALKPTTNQPYDRWSKRIKK